MSAFRRRGFEVEHRGARFSSRLVARWAVFFDLIGWGWVYRPFGADGLVPDFLVLGERPLLVQILMATARREYRAEVERVEAALAGVWRGDALLVGTSPVVAWETVGGPPVMGLLGERCEWGSRSKWEWEAAVLSCCACASCVHEIGDQEGSGGAGRTVLSLDGDRGRLTVVHRTGIYKRRPCGTRDGGRIPVVAEGCVAEIVAWWNQAGSRVGLLA